MTWLAAALSVLALVPGSQLVPGGTVAFTGSYPNDARQKIGAQQRINPAFQVDCSQGGSNVLEQVQGVASETRSKDGTWTGTSAPFLLDFAGAADCSVALYYWNKDPRTHALILVPLASLAFSVG